MRTKHVQQEEHALRHFETLDEEEKKHLIASVKNFYDYITQGNLSPFDVGEALSILEAGELRQVVVGKLTSTHLRWLLQDEHFLRDTCGYGVDTEKIRLSYSDLTQYLKFYFLYRAWPDLAREVNCVKRVMLANENSTLRLPEIRKGRLNFHCEPEPFLNEVITIGYMREGPTYAKVRNMLKACNSLPVGDEHRLHDFVKENWAEIFSEWRLVYGDSEVLPGLTKGLDFVASKDEVFFAIELKVAADEPGYVGDLLSNVSELRLIGSYRKGYRNVHDPIGDIDTRIPILLDCIMGMMIAQGFSWEFVLAAYGQPIVLVRLSDDARRVQRIVNASEPPSIDLLEGLVGREFPYRGRNLVHSI